MSCKNLILSAKIANLDDYKSESITHYYLTQIKKALSFLGCFTPSSTLRLLKISQGDIKSFSNATGLVASLPSKFTANIS